MKYYEILFGIFIVAIIGYVKCNDYHRPLDNVEIKRQDKEPYHISLVLDNEKITIPIDSTITVNDTSWLYAQGQQMMMQTKYNVILFNFNIKYVWDSLISSETKKN